MRRPLLVAVGIVASVWATAASARAEPAAAPRGEVRIVDRGTLTWAFMTYNVFEHLIRIDRDGQLVPELATSWRWLDETTLEAKLRRGVKFQNGEVFDAEIVKINVEGTRELRSHFHIGSYFHFKPTTRVEIVDPYTVRFVFAEPDGAALARLTFLHIANRQFYREGGWGNKHW